MKVHQSFGGGGNDHTYVKTSKFEGYMKVHQSFEGTWSRTSFVPS